MVSNGARIVALSLIAALTAPALAAQEHPARPSLNLYGQPGLIDLPSAEALPDGEVAGSWAWFEGTERRHLTVQFLPWLTGTLRFANLPEFGGVPEDFDDRSLDLTFQLLSEGRLRPAVAIGLRDVFGTGVYSSEFVVATKRVHSDLALTAGIGWGRLAGIGGFDNPFCTLGGDGACTRPDEIGTGGRLATDRFFRGETAAPFAGIAWRTPLRPLTLMAEYSPDAYEGEVAGGFERRERFSLGAEYRIAPGIALGAYWLHGSTLGVNIAITANPNRPLVPPNLAPGPIPVMPRQPEAPTGRGWAADEGARGQLGQALVQALEAEGLRLHELRVTPEIAEIRVENRRYGREPQAIGRALRILQTGMPASVETFRVTVLREGVPATTTSVNRAAYEASIDAPRAGERLWAGSAVEGAALGVEAGAGLWRNEDIYPAFAWSVAPAPFFVNTGPDDPSRIGLNAAFGASLRLAPGFSVTAGISQLLLGPSGDPGPVPTALPPVRTQAVRYFAGRTPDLTRLSADWIGRAAPDVYLRASGGYLERMFGGVSGEVLWKPAGERWGVGLEVNHVAQRDVDGFGFGEFDYAVTSGHASLYWDTGWRGLEMQLDAGRYLAGDWGATVRASRRFQNGWSLGAFATMTDAGGDEFGPGRFDRGVTLEVPLAWGVPFETRQVLPLTFRTVTRDGGARLAVANRLYPIVRDLDRPRLERNWGAVWQ